VVVFAIAAGMLVLIGGSFFWVGATSIAKNKK